jgi:hypothetical protein
MSNTSNTLIDGGVRPTSRTRTRTPEPGQGISLHLSALSTNHVLRSPADREGLVADSCFLAQPTCARYTLDQQPAYSWHVPIPHTVCCKFASSKSLSGDRGILVLLPWRS